MESGRKPEHSKAVWPSGLRRWLQALIRKGVGSNPTAVILQVRQTLWEAYRENKMRRSPELAALLQSGTICAQSFLEALGVGFFFKLVTSAYLATLLCWSLAWRRDACPLQSLDGSMHENLLLAHSVQALGHRISQVHYTWQYLNLQSWIPKTNALPIRPQGQVALWWKLRLPCQGSEAP